MDKRLFLAVAFSLLILLSWSAFVSRVYHIDNKEVTQEKVSSPAPVASEKIPSLPIQDQAEKTSLFNVSNEKFEIIFSEPQAAIKEATFKSYQSHVVVLRHGFLLGDNNFVFKRENVSADSVVFVYADAEKKITKEFIFSKSNFDIRLGIKIRNLTSSPLNLSLPLFLGELDFSGNQEEARFKDLTVSGPEKLLHPNAHKDAVFSEIKFMGIRDRYFCAILEPEDSASYSGFVKKINPQISEVGLQSKEITVPPYQEVGQKFHIYLGPQELRAINSVRPGWAVMVNYGTFDFISQFLLQSLEFFYRLSHNWGLAIIILSLVIYFLFYPLSLKQMRSMKEMQALQPHIEDLRKHYKDNPQKLNKEIMELYRKHKVNPFSGCLPLILQMPIFFALYQALMRSISLRGATFLWIKDLSHPDRLFLLPTSLPLLGNEINILPIVMTVGMFIQQKISMATTATSSSAEQQKIMMIIMPLMFGFIFYHMPAGLVLYWFVNSMLMLAFQFKINKAR